jgi:hypothetical protein
MIGKNSMLNKNNKHAAFANVKIKNKTEKTGFLVKITKNYYKIFNPEKIEKKKTLANIKYKFLVFIFRPITTSGGFTV